ncbi:MAG: cytidine deaminase [Alphaproteobacteria bacterium]|nr:cytidine deaminase [Alphaproteobacteria bacterium]
MRPDPEMFARARAVMDQAYAPYSGFHVGCSLRGAGGRLYSGANVENAAYPQGWCAETSAIAAMIADGEREIAEVLVIGARRVTSGGYEPDPKALCTPCGGCRQKLNEFAAATTLVHVCGPEGVRKSFTLGELLPAAFGPNNLAP